MYNNNNKNNILWKLFEPNIDYEGSQKFQNWNNGGGEGLY